MNEADDINRLPAIYPRQQRSATKIPSTISHGAPPAGLPVSLKSWFYTAVRIDLPAAALAGRAAPSA
jgi:hypothetical protein